MKRYELSLPDDLVIKIKIDNSVSDGYGVFEGGSFDIYIYSEYIQLFYLNGQRRGTAVYVRMSLDSYLDFKQSFDVDIIETELDDLD